MEKLRANNFLFLEEKNPFSSTTCRVKCGEKSPVMENHVTSTLEIKRVDMYDERGLTVMTNQKFFFFKILFWFENDHNYWK
jgi:hypothetical protein